MPRKPLIRSNTQFYHVTAISNNRESFYCSPELTWNIFIYELHEIVEAYQAQIHSFVLMPNCFHLMINTPTVTLEIVMQRFMLSVTKTLNLHSGRINRVFGARYHWSLINETYYNPIVKYIYREPVEIGLSKIVEDYPFSTSSVILGKQTFPFPIHSVDGKKVIHQNEIENLMRYWNKPFTQEQDDAIERGLKRTKFLPAAKNNWKRQRINLS